MPNLPDSLIDRFRRFRHRHFAPHTDHYEKLASYGQSPEVMIVSCCDSRVDPESIFTCMPGEMFVVRNVANLVPPFETSGTYHGVSAALEFAILNLRVKHIVVMGHSQCGGILACAGGQARQSEARFISNWMSMLDETRDAIMKKSPGLETAQIAGQLEREGIKASLANLRSFPCVRTQEAAGKLTLHGAFFDIGSGILSALDEKSGEFLPV